MIIILIYRPTSNYNDKITMIILLIITIMIIIIIFKIIIINDKLL